MGGRGRSQPGEPNNTHEAELPQFEWDEKKNKSNKLKHGIDFEEAKEIWRDIHRKPLPGRMVSGESRQVTIGKIGDRLRVAVYTMRGKIVRLISARPANEKEKPYYGSRIHDGRN